MPQQLLEHVSDSHQTEHIEDVLCLATASPKFKQQSVLPGLHVLGRLRTTGLDHAVALTVAETELPPCSLLSISTSSLKARTST